MNRAYSSVSKKTIIPLFLIFVGVSALSACNGIAVHDNTYDSVGGVSLHVDDALTYLGQADVFGHFYDQNPETPGYGATMDMKVRTDVWVQASDGLVEMVCVIERRVLPSRCYWNSPGGRQFTLGGMVCSGFFVRPVAEQDDHVMQYAQFLAAKGYDVGTTPMGGLVLVRDITRNKRVLISVFVNLDTLQERLGDDATDIEIQEALTNIFFNVIQPVGS